MPTSLELADAEGCVLAEDVTAAVSLPSFDNSSMDGYAVVAADIDGRLGRGAVEPPGHRRDRGRRHRRLPAGPRHRHQDHDRRAAAGRGGRRRPGRVDRRRRRRGRDLPSGRGGRQRALRRGRRGRGRDPADGGDADAADARRGGRVGRAQAGHGPPAAPGGGALDRGRADRAGHPAGARPDLGLQQLHAARGGQGGGRARLPARRGPRRPGRACCPRSKSSSSGPTC